MKLSELVQHCGIKIPFDCEIRQIENDSRNIKHGALFFALKGSHADGAAFIKQALEKGAAAVFCEGQVPEMFSACAPGKPFVMQAADIYSVLSSAAAAFYGNPSSKMRMFGITGTKGKTTSSCILEKILDTAGMRPGLIGTLAYKAAGEIISDSVNTTPFSHTLHKTLHEMLEKNCKSAVMEVSSHALALKRAEDVSFDIAVFTNLQRDHLDFHKDIRHYFLAKIHLFEILAAKGKGPKAAVINADDPCCHELYETIRHLGLPAVTYGIKHPAVHAHCDFRAEEIVLEEKYSSFNLHYGETSRPVKISLPGFYNVYNALAAISAAIAGGVPFDAAVRGAESVANVPGRLQRVEKGQNFNVFVDYAHTEAAIENVLSNLMNMPHRRIITVFGCGGDRDRTKRAPMGIAACSGSDYVYVTDDNPRYESREQIFADIEKGIKGKFDNYEIIQDRGSAIKQAIMSAGKGDIVLIAGKGHENYQLVKDKKIHFSDTEQAAEAIEQKLAMNSEKQA